MLQYKENVIAESWPVNRASQSADESQQKADHWCIVLFPVVWDFLIPRSVEAILEALGMADAKMDWEDFSQGNFVALSVTCITFFLQLRRPCDVYP